MANRRFEAAPQQPGALTDSVGDGQLLARFTAQRDELAEVAFAALVRRHGPMVLHLCRQVLGDHHAAEDAFQATFLILARRARSIRQPELLGNWLYGVALRTAREVRMREDRRRRREKPERDGLSDQLSSEGDRPDAPLGCREEFAVLHEEVSRLPEQERTAVVLCSLEGLTYQEAALRLCCPVGTIGVRLSRARERLRLRLTRRGLAPSAALLGGLFAADIASAGMPSALAGSTIEAAAAFVSGGAMATGLISKQVVALAEAVLRAIVLRRLTTAGLLAVAVGVSVTIAWVSVRREVRNPVEPAQAKTQPKLERPGDPTRLGQAVVRPEGEPPSPAKPPAPLLADRRPVDPGTKPGVGRSTREERALGEALFAKEWMPNDARSHGGDGLGPVYNETSCMACHGLGAPGGAGPESKNVALLSATPLTSTPAAGPDQVHPGFRGARSTVLHRFGTDPEYASWRRQFYLSDPGEVLDNPAGRNEDSIEGRIHGLRDQTTASHRVRDRTFRPKSSKDFSFTLTERNPPALFGAGRIDAIPSELLMAVAREQPREVRGRLSRTPKGGLGRFGWKAQIASLDEFVRAACANELGLEVPGHHQGVAPLAPDDKAKGLDLTEAECDAMVAYVRALPAPVVVDPTGPRGTPDMVAGRRLFAVVGCASCHTPSLGDVRGIYSDLLLHDMGPSLGDSGNYYATEDSTFATPPSLTEWRTPPLWGYRDSGPYLHDGRAQSLDEAVALHEAQGKSAARRFFALSAQERLQIESFLKSLVAPSSTAMSGVLLGAEMETRADPHEQETSETDIRRARQDEVARDEQQWQDGVRRRQAESAANLARARLAAAADLEKMNKIAGALDFYRQIVREAPDTEEGRRAAARIAALTTRTAAP